MRNFGLFARQVRPILLAAQNKALAFADNNEQQGNTLFSLVNQNNKRDSHMLEHLVMPPMRNMRR